MDIKPCYNCNASANSGAGCLGARLGCALCAAVGNNDGTIPSKYYQETVTLPDGTVFSPPKVNCVRCKDTKVLARIIRLKPLPGWPVRSDGLTGREPSVVLSCPLCCNAEFAQQEKQVIEHFAKFPYPEYKKFESVAEAMSYSS
jgi:hypothetical protein